ncbi:MAG: methyltransferase domain-containing protein [Nitrospirae bacterium]|nr:methyltransferase domain-containing protein [Nitrospirota bacterium]
MKDIFEQAKELRDIWGGFRASRVLLTANDYRVFDHLTKPQSVRTISKKLNTDLRATEILLDALAGLDLLKKKKDRYLNSPIASKFLVTGSPYYQGDIIRHADNLWKNWSCLDEVVKTGKPNRQAHNQDAFIRGMHNLASLKAKKVINAIGLKGVKTALDLGGGPGTYTMEMAKKGISVTLFDRPETIEIARKVVNNAPRPPLKLRGGEGGVKFIQGDFLCDDFGKGYDLIFISQVLHAYSEDDNIRILKESRRALNPDGRIVIQEFYINDDRTYPPQSALFSINMLVNTEAGRCYSPSELKGWLSEAGFRDIKDRMIDDSVLVFGRNSG